MSKEQKEEIIKKFQRHEGDTGSPEVQVALLSARINNLTEHLKVFKSDYSSRRGLFKLVGERRRLLNYVKETDKARYQRILKEFGLRA
ncbi:MAG: 30S ribosomal protein S15 [Caldiserica bacterium]|nr:30S ribosomal protein S15 [Caldisericota bacterium]NCO28877.1 30S ribosomal protein S15 [Caldisericota bacterium]